MTTAGLIMLAMAVFPTPISSCRTRVALRTVCSAAAGSEGREQLARRSILYSAAAIGLSLQQPLVVKAEQVVGAGEDEGRVDLLPKAGAAELSLSQKQASHLPPCLISHQQQCIVIIRVRPTEAGRGSTEACSEYPHRSLLYRHGVLAHVNSSIEQHDAHLSASHFLSFSATVLRVHKTSFADRFLGSRAIDCVLLSNLQLSKRRSVNGASSGARVQQENSSSEQSSEGLSLVCARRLRRQDPGRRL